MIRSSRNWQLLRALAMCIRLITPHQLSSWWGVPVANAKRDLRRLESGGLATEITIRARKLPEVTGPFYRWSPGDPAPHFGKLSYQAKERFRGLPPCLMAAYIPTRLTLSQFGVSHRQKIKRTHCTHEIGVSESYLYFFKRWPRLTERCWRGEDLYAHERGPGEKVEDSHLVHPTTGRVMLAIEYAGSYPTSRFRELHETFSAPIRQTPYLMF